MFIVGCIDNILTDGGSFFRLHLFFVYGLSGVFDNPLFRAFERLFNDIDQKKFTARHGAFQIIADVRADSAGADDGDFVR